MSCLLILTTLNFEIPKSLHVMVFWGRLIHFLHSLIFKTLLCHPCFSRLRHFAAQSSTSLHNKQRETGQGFPKKLHVQNFELPKWSKLVNNTSKKREKRIERIQKNVSSFSISSRKYSEKNYKTQKP